jgi:exosortase A-associated hydrolase 1
LLARHLASQGIPAMRFDYRGMGDSQGASRNFEDIGEDIRAAIDQFMAAVPNLREVALWGLCDAASAALLYAHQDARVRGLALLNPWVRTEQGLAKAYLKRYYLKRAFDAGLWQKIVRGRFDFQAAARSLLGMLRFVLSTCWHAAPALKTGALSLPDKMYEGLCRFNGPILLVLSGDDMTAQEFSGLISASQKWRQLLAARTIQRHRLAAANHTFSRQEWRDQVAAWTSDWLRGW